MTRVDNSNLVGFTPLAPPVEAKRRYPATAEVEDLVLTTREQLRQLLRGEDRRRLAVIIGPCSIHDQEAAYEYARRLKNLRGDLCDALLIVMRTYFEKPRTTVGWKGLINDPHLDGSCDIAEGLLRARQTLLTINGLGVPCASEALDPVTPQYLSDLLSWASIGARTTESQTHREMASGLSMPVGFKNGTDGSLTPAINALISAGHSHRFLGVDGAGNTAIVQTTGNQQRHIVLRGGARPNYYTEDVDAAAARMREVEPALARPLMVDTSHGNSSKDYTRQGHVLRDVVSQFARGQDALLGLLVESNLEPGKQKWAANGVLKHGVSITDGCIGWEETEELLQHAASEVRQRSAKLSA